MSVPETLTLPSPDSSLVLGQVLLREWVLIKKEAEYIEWDEETKKRE